MRPVISPEALISFSALAVKSGIQRSDVSRLASEGAIYAPPQTYIGEVRKVAAPEVQRVIQIANAARAAKIAPKVLLLAVARGAAEITPDGRVLLGHPEGMGEIA